MTLQSTPPITAGDINVELGRSRTAAFDINGTAERKLAGKLTGPISFSDFLGKSSVTPGSQTFSSSGTFTVPNYNTMTVTANGSGGGGGSSTGNDGGGGHNPGGDGGTGGNAVFSLSGAVITATGGGGGGGGLANGDNTTPGTNGGGSGGTVTTGGGAAGGAGGTFLQAYSGSKGGNGGKVVKTFTLGSGTTPTPGNTISITVGNGGVGGVHPNTQGDNGDPGTKGSVVISWS